MSTQNEFGMSLRSWLTGHALSALHGQISDIFVSSLIPPDQMSSEETKAYFEKRVREIGLTAVAVADGVIAALEGSVQ